MHRERAFLVPAAPDPALLERARAAHAAGWIPDTVLLAPDGAETRVGDAPAGALDPLEVAEGDFLQLLQRRRLPRWVAAKNPLGGGFVEVKALMRQRELVTVCEEASCPNIGRCWARGTATFMISGSRCTRGCRFCDVVSARPFGPPDPEEPARLAEAAAQMGLRFVVVTAVARDDLPDGGAAHFAAVIHALRARLPETKVEVLIPDLRGSVESLEAVIEARPDVLNHNTETVPRLYKRVRPGARYERTLQLLARSAAAGLRTKSGIMVGLGERLPEVATVLGDLASVGCELVTIGQYLQPSSAHLPVERFYAPAEYPALAGIGRSLGVGHVEAGPLVRSSFEADRVAESVPVAV